MAAIPEKVLNWLYSVLPGEYADVNRTYHDVTEALSNYLSLSPRTEVYTYENGASALLLVLSGTLPVVFRGATYGFPVAIWVPHAYPREPPIIYVTPSPDMLVRPGQHVSGDGRVYHPYLAQWGKYWDKSTIFDFLAVLRGVFAKEPPVRSKQQPNAPSQPAPPPVPPPPKEWQKPIQVTPVASPSSAHTSQAPVPPPKPPKPYEQNRPSPQPPLERPYGTLQQAPPLPPLPQKHQNQPYQQPPPQSYGAQSNWQQLGPGPVPPRQPSYDPNPQTPASKPLPPQIQSHGQGYKANSYEIGSPVSPITPNDQPQRPGHRYQQPAPPPPNYPPPQHSQPPPHSQQRYPSPMQPPYPVPPYPASRHPSQPLQQASSTPKPAPTNLLDDPLEVTLPSQTGTEVPLPRPPVPPNPEKDALLRALSQTLTSQLHQTLSSNSNAIPALLHQQTALKTAYTALKSESNELQRLDKVLASNERVLREAMREADRVIQRVRAGEVEVPDVDEVLVAPTVVGGQLYSLCAEEKAIGEVLFVLRRGLDRGVVPADLFVKQTRSLARERFLKKALVRKCARGLALDEGMGR
ncbi:UEV-domain-containing protein [Delitschia confertaspora ATCC 74209]|uniref:UEV-domain-containing protein n=1 Tax=Delitschia confertaspora ATCC 74209 TaxID=1513339 RepID=A0A9P4JRV5_9PLEO|nr:UEV-domain-containing protein [Delitschia confertaspora ATCC 74209]